VGNARVLALDVGGTTIKAAIAGPDGSLLSRVRRDTGRAAGPDVVVKTILALADELAAQVRADGCRLAAAAIVVPGVVNEHSGVAVDSSNIGWRDVPLRDLAVERLGAPVQVGHDVRAGALAEARRGAARGRSSSLFLPLGTGIGGAMVIGTTPYAGANFAAAELGHVVVRPDGDVCVCGRVGCLETVASASAIARRYSAATGSTVAGAVDVAERLERGDATAKRVWDEAVEAIADALVLAATLLDPEVVVVGGGLSHSGPRLLEPLRQSMSRRVTVGPTPELTRAQLGDEAGCVGAALLALDLVDNKS
jgi:glucokinase